MEICDIAMPSIGYQRKQRNTFLEKAIEIKRVDQGPM